MKWEKVSGNISLRVERKRRGLYSEGGGAGEGNKSRGRGDNSPAHIATGCFPYFILKDINI